jgi:hypothetical protein
MPVPSYRQQLFHTESCRAFLHKSPQRINAYWTPMRSEVDSLKR